MNWYETLFELLKYIVPIAVVFAFIYFILNNYLEENFKLRSLDLKLQNQQSISPLRMQAYERIVVYLERISPSALITRIHKSGMSSKLLHVEMIKSIRSEYEHNIAQQIYMSNASWELVKSAKEEMIKLINTSAHKVSENSDGIELCKVLLDVTMNVEKLPTQIALDYVKKEIRQSF
jgi:flagellar biosynthesis protein FlhB